MKKVASLTSGGDAPGMNAAVRAIIRGSAYFGLEVTAIRHGYKGLIEGDFVDLERNQAGIEVIQVQRHFFMRFATQQMHIRQRLQVVHIDENIA